jgi:hypothetical protein
MRTLLALLAAGVWLIACSTDGSSPRAANPTPTTATPTATAARPPVLTPEGLVSVDPRFLLLPTDQMIPGRFTAREGTLASAQFNRSWERDPADPGYAAGTARVTANARLFLSLADARSEFDRVSAGEDGLKYVQVVIGTRGVPVSAIRAAEVELPPLGVEGQRVWRAEFGETRNETYVQYFVFLRQKNTTVLLTTVAQNVNGAEAPNLLAETTELAQRQARYLLDLTSR